MRGIGLVRLGVRLATAGGRGAVIGLVLTSIAVALGTAILLFALSFQPALNNRLERGAWRDTQILLTDREPATSGVLMVTAENRFRDQVLHRVLLAPFSPEPPIPPGVSRLPGPGEAFVSPALRRLMAEVPADQLANGIGRVAGTIGDEALRSPDELLAVVGTDRHVLEDYGAFIVDAFPRDPRVPDLPPILVLLVVFAVVGALAPVVVFVGTATRLSAARREQRLAALRLVGATPMQVARLAAVEALIPCVAGAVLGVLLFLATRPLVARVPLDDATWLPEAIAPPLWQAALLLAAVPVVGVLTATVTLRRIVVTPLGVHRRQTPGSPGLLRLLPLIGSIVALAVLLPLVRGEGASDLGLVVLGTAFGGVVLGIALAGPWLTAAVGAVLRRGPGGAATLLAARRLSDDPRGSFGSIAGVVMAVFIASAFFTFVAFARVQAGVTGSMLREQHVFVGGALGSVSDGRPSLADEIAALPGVEHVLPVIGGELFVDGPPVIASIVPCEAFLEVVVVDGAKCTNAAVHTVTGSIPPGTFDFVPDATVDGRFRIATPVTLPDASAVIFEGPAFDAYLLPSVIIDPSVVSGELDQAAATSLYVRTDGSTAAEERVLATALARNQAANVRTAAETAGGERMYIEFGRVVELGLVGSLVLAGCSLAVAVTTAMLDRRRQFAFLRSAGMPVGRLRAVVLLQAGVPLVAVALFSAALGIGVAQLVLRLGAAPIVAWPDASLAVVLLVSVTAAMAVVALTLPPLERLTHPESVRAE